MRRLAVLLAMLCAATGWCATYYIDYEGGADSNGGLSRTSAWKTAPGMVGFAGSYVHQAGDIFVFKGGVTWPASTLPLTISASGQSGAVDQYRSDPTWFSGASFELPVFDGQFNAGSIGFDSYPDVPAFSDASVLFVPEPMTLLLLVLGGLMVTRRRA